MRQEVLTKKYLDKAHEAGPRHGVSSLPVSGGRLLGAVQNMQGEIDEETYEETYEE